MRILVLGSLGTLGTPLTEALKKRGHRVFEADLYHSDRGEDYVRTDIREFRQLQRTMLDVEPELVYHLAAEFGRNNGEEYYENLWTTNVIGTRHLLEIQKEMDFKMVFASGSEVYGDIDVDWMDEELLFKRWIDHHNDYAITKYVNEKQILRFTKLYENPNLVCRFFNAYGPGEYYHPYRSVVCLFCYRMLKGLPITVYRNYHRVFMYIDDFISTLSSIPQAPMQDKLFKGTVINIGGTEYRTIEELVDVIQKVTGKVHDQITYIDKETANVTNKRPNIAKASQWLGHNPTTTLEEGVKATIDWMKATYNL